MKLLFYIPGLVDGGAERVMATLASQFARKGHEVSLAVDFTVDGAGAGLSDDVQLIPLASGHGGAVRHLARLLREEQFDLAISAIASCCFKLSLASLLARFRLASPLSTAGKTTKTILTYHGFEEYKTGTLSYLGTALLPLLSRHSRAIIAVSYSLEGELKNRWKAKADKLWTIYNPVAPPPAPAGFTFPQSEKDLIQRDNIVLAAGRLVTDKRFDLLLRAMGRLKDPKSRLIILGEGPERASLQKLINRLGLDERVEMPGFIEDTGSYFALAKCFVLTSKQESFGLVLVEALAYGLPVLSTNRGGPGEVLLQGRYGTLLGNDPNEEEVALAIEKALNHPGSPLPRLARAKEFDITTGMQNYSDLFNLVLRDKI